MLTLLGAVGLNGFLPANSQSLWYPMSELDLDHSRIKQKSDDKEDNKKSDISFSPLPHLGRSVFSFNSFILLQKINYNVYFL